MVAKSYRRCTIKHTETVVPTGITGGVEPIRKPYHATKTSECYIRAKHHGRYCPGRVTKQGRLVREKVGHKAWVNWVY